MLWGKHYFNQSYPPIMLNITTMRFAAHTLLLEVYLPWSLLYRILPSLQLLKPSIPLFCIVLVSKPSALNIYGLFYRSIFFFFDI